MKTVITSGFKRVSSGSSYFKCTVEHGNNNNSIGDALWFSKDGSECEICDDILDRVSIQDLAEIFDNDSVIAIIKRF